jgi:hypothetical protein
LKSLHTTPTIAWTYLAHASSGAVPLPRRCRSCAHPSSTRTPRCHPRPVATSIWPTPRSSARSRAPGARSENVGPRQVEREQLGGPSRYWAQRRDENGRAVMITAEAEIAARGYSTHSLRRGALTRRHVGRADRPRRHSPTSSSSATSSRGTPAPSNAEARSVRESGLARSHAGPRGAEPDARAA